MAFGQLSQTTPEPTRGGPEVAAPATPGRSVTRVVAGHPKPPAPALGSERNRYTQCNETERKTDRDKHTKTQTDTPPWCGHRQTPEKPGPPSARREIDTHSAARQREKQTETNTQTHKHTTPHRENGVRSSAEHLYTLSKRIKSRGAIRKVSLGDMSRPFRP